MRETRELRSDQEETRKSFAQAFSKACRARDSVSRPFSVSKRRKDTKNIPVGCFSKKTLAGGFLNAVPDGGRLSPIPPEIPPKRVQRAAGDFNRLCGCPSRPLVPKGGTRFRGQGRRACGSPLRAVGPPKKSRLPARSALNGAHRAPAPPDEGSCVPVARAQDRPERKRRPLRKAFRRKPFLPSCVCRRRLRPQGRCPRTPTAFEKAGKTFPCLYLTRARGRYVPVGRCPAADRAGRRDKGQRLSENPAALSAVRVLSRAVTHRDLRAQALRRELSSPATDPSTGRLPAAPRKLRRP